MSMLELLSDVLLEYGLELNSKKTKILCNEHVNEETVHCITKCGSIEILAAAEKHKYLGRMFSGEIRNRGKVAVAHRISCGWMKYHALQHIFEDKHIPICLRLKLFDVAITPTILYSLETCPLTDHLQERLNIVQRTMLRRMVGWVCRADDTWEERGRRMKDKMSSCLSRHPINEWSESIYERKAKCLNDVEDLPFWTRSALNWDPVICARANFCNAFRLRGHPLTRWYDDIS